MKKNFLCMLIMSLAFLMVGCNNEEPTNGTNTGANASDIASTNKVTNDFGTVYEVILKDENRMYFMVSGTSEVIMTGYHRFYGYADEKNDNFSIYGYKGNLVVPSSIKLDGTEYTVVAVEGMGNIKENNTLKTVELPNTIKSIGNSAFSDCVALTTIKIPESVEIIESFAFSNCSSLTNIKIPESVEKIEGYTFSNCSSLTKVELPASITEIGGYCFENCTALENINLENIQELGLNCFSGCTSLKEINLFNITNSITHEAFLNCSKLEKIILGANLTEFHYTTFEGCEAIKDMYIYATTPPIGGYYLRYIDFILHVPASAVNAYKDDNNDWNYYYRDDYDEGIERTIVAIEE